MPRAEPVPEPRSGANADGTIGATSAYSSGAPAALRLFRPAEPVNVEPDTALTIDANGTRLAMTRRMLVLSSRRGSRCQTDITDPLPTTPQPNEIQASLARAWRPPRLPKAGHQQ
jgi:hypothetical protein